MKTLQNIAGLVLIFICTYVQGQEVEKNLDEAKSAYKSENYEDARFALQQALVEIDKEIGKQILAVLPESMGGLKYNVNNEQVTGMSSGYVGLFVSRSFGTAEDGKTSDIQVISDSPMLAGINAILAMPTFVAGMGDPNQKRIKVDGYKGLLQKNVAEDGTITSFDVQIPFGSSLLSVNFKGFSNENDVIAMTNTIPISKVVGITK